MDKKIKDFLGRLVTMKHKAEQENTCVKTVYNRAESGVYKLIVIDGIKFIEND